MQIPEAAAILQQSCPRWTEQKPAAKPSLACLACFDILRPQSLVSVYPLRVCWDNARASKAFSLWPLSDGCFPRFPFPNALP